ncbi:hypothetical protein cand_018300 [Cryptosporidium andersoni]|uniref:Uncharacterized protein n=1 Tax=Cryptosporidium andersoni TaxID=117008 RepID=A0A1J4MJA7_9CRYT|nr:hypothetical protein cand_018300 [Cryptosporidium andersoni]
MNLQLTALILFLTTFYLSKAKFGYIDNEVHSDHLLNSSRFDESYILQDSNEYQRIIDYNNNTNLNRTNKPKNIEKFWNSALSPIKKKKTGHYITRTNLFTCETYIDERKNNIEQNYENKNTIINQSGLSKYSTKQNFKLENYKKENIKSINNPKFVSWKCYTNTDIYWIPNEKVLKRKFTSLTDELGVVYSVPYLTKSLLSLCSGGYTEFIGSGKLPSNFTFVKIHDCISLVMQ